MNRWILAGIILGLFLAVPLCRIVLNDATPPDRTLPPRIPLVASD